MKPLNPLVDQYLRNKFGENYQKDADAEYEDRLNRSNTGNLFSNLGDVIAGQKVGSANKYFEGVNQAAKDETVGKIDKSRKEYAENLTLEKSQRDNELMDPNSNSSKAFRLAVERVAPGIAKQYGDTWATVSAADQDSIWKPIQFKEQQDARKQAAVLAAQSRADALAAKSAEKQEKKKQSMNEIQDRYNNIKDSITSLSKVVEDNGTQELFGPENKQMDQYITSIATDMAKLVDPQSVARESEVASFKKMLFEPGFFQQDSSVQGVLSNFDKIVDKRLKNAYAVRGLEAPAGKQPETKIINGKTFKKVEGGWQEI